MTTPLLDAGTHAAIDAIHRNRNELAASIADAVERATHAAATQQPKTQPLERTDSNGTTPPARVAAVRHTHADLVVA
jgi:hypothetical protein